MNRDITRLTVYAGGLPLYLTTWGQLKTTYPMLQEADFDCFLSSGCDHRIYLDNDGYVTLT